MINIRNNPAQVVLKIFNFNDPGIDTGLPLVLMPANSQYVLLRLMIHTAFNATTANNFTMGISPTGNTVCQTGDAAVGTAGLKDITRIYDLNPQVSLRTVYYRYVFTGTPPNQGKGQIIMEWIPPGSS